MYTTAWRRRWAAPIFGSPRGSTFRSAFGPASEAPRSGDWICLMSGPPSRGLGRSATLSGACARSNRRSPLAAPAGVETTPAALLLPPLLPPASPGRVLLGRRTLPPLAHLSAVLDQW